MTTKNNDKLPPLTLDEAVFLLKDSPSATALLMEQEKKVEKLKTAKAPMTAGAVIGGLLLLAGSQTKSTGLVAAGIVIGFGGLIASGMKKSWGKQISGLTPLKTFSLCTLLL
ncbi:MAG: hypothetical protein JNN12_15910 [Bacteroidetes Order II. Incertae sedis bacterium]|nr:hypothetical protein [Bacteroidetes Order II. bacterium]